MVVPVTGADRTQYTGRMAEYSRRFYAKCPRRQRGNAIEPMAACHHGRNGHQPSCARTVTRRLERTFSLIKPPCISSFDQRHSREGTDLIRPTAALRIRSRPARTSARLHATSHLQQHANAPDLMPPARAWPPRQGTGAHGGHMPWCSHRQDLPRQLFSPMGLLRSRGCTRHGAIHTAIT